MRAENFKVEELIESLKGTCQSISQILSLIHEEMFEEDLSYEDLEAIDSEIFCCETCGWWWEISECADENVCLECHEEEE